MLDPISVRRYWTEQSQAIATLLDLMDQREPWTRDGKDPEFDKAILRLGEHLRDLPWSDIPPEITARILAYMSSSRALRVTQLLETHAPEALVKLISTSIERPHEPEFNVNNMRITVFARNDLLREILSKERRKILLECLEEMYNHDNA